MPATSQAPDWKRYAKAIGALALALAALPLVPPFMDGGDPGDTLKLSLGATVIGVLCLAGAYLELKKRQLIRDTPTSPVRSLAVGDVEVKGRARPVEDPPLSPLSHKEACVFVFEVEEEHEGDKGSDWHTVLQLRKGIPFEVDDGTGRVLVDAEDADLDMERERRVHVDAGELPPEAVRTWAEESDRFDVSDADGNEGLIEAVDDTLSADDASQHLAETSLHDRRYTETVLAVDEETYVLGGAEPREGVSSAENAEHLVIRRHEGTGQFILSDRSEAELVGQTFTSVAVLLALAVFLIPAGLIGFLTLAGLV